MADNRRRGSKDEDVVRAFGDGIHAAATTIELDSDDDGSRRASQSGAGGRTRDRVIAIDNTSDDAVHVGEGASAVWRKKIILYEEMTEYIRESGRPRSKIFTPLTDKGST